MTLARKYLISTDDTPYYHVIGKIRDRHLKIGLVGVSDLAEQAITPLLGGVFKNAGAFGTNAHTALVLKISGYKPFPGVEIEAEVFFLDDGNNGGSQIPKGKPKRQKGALGIDILIRYKGDLY